jgi:hypothetical protein
MNIDVIFATIIMLAVSIMILRVLWIDYKSDTLCKLDKNKKPKLPKKSVKLFSQRGVLLYEYRDVYITHWDENIYLLSYEQSGETFLRIDKGDGMLLMVES